MCLVINPLSDTWFTNMFPLSIDCSLTLLNVSLAMQMVLV